MTSIYMGSYICPWTCILITLWIQAPFLISGLFDRLTWKSRLQTWRVVVNSSCKYCMQYFLTVDSTMRMLLWKYHSSLKQFDMEQCTRWRVKQNLSSTVFLLKREEPVKELEESDNSKKQTRKIFLPYKFVYTTETETLVGEIWGETSCEFIARKRDRRMRGRDFLWE